MMTCNKKEYRIGHPIDTYDISEGGVYCSHWGLVDLYPQCEKNLRQLIDSQEDFMTEWCGSKKELLSAQYGRIEGSFDVWVRAWMDDLWDSYDLISDAIYEVLHDDEKYPLPLSVQEKLKRYSEDNIDEEAEEFFENVRQYAWEADITDSVCHSVSFNPKGITYEKVMEAVEKLEDEAMAHLHRMYEVLCGIVADTAREV